MPSCNGDRLSQARRLKRGIQFEIEVFIPIPNGKRLIPQKGREIIVEKVNPNLKEFCKFVESLNGIAQVRQIIPEKTEPISPRLTT